MAATTQRGQITISMGRLDYHGWDRDLVGRWRRV